MGAKRLVGARIGPFILQAATVAVSKHHQTTERILGSVGGKMKRQMGFSYLTGCGVCIVLLVLGCDPMNPKPDYYHVSLTLNGQEITLNYGLRDIHLDDPTAFLSLDGNYIAIQAQNQQAEAGTLVSIGSSLSVTPGNYTARYEAGQTASAGMMICEGPTGYPYNAVSGFVTIDTFGDVGGEVDGSFYLIFESTSAAPLYGTPLAASGDFRLLRIADRSFP